MAVVDERWPISMSQIGFWRDLTQSMKLRAWLGLSGVEVWRRASVRSTTWSPSRRVSGVSSKPARSTNSVPSVP